jgi:protein-ribulosamine 3-kinase
MLNSIPSEIQEKVRQILKSELKSFSFSGGGCINNGGRLSTSKGDIFIKWNDRKIFPGMFEAEARGLKLLRDTNTLHIPNVVSVGETNDHQFILLEFIEQRTKQNSYWQELGEGLGKLHRTTSPTFGLDHDNYIGSLPQKNLPAKSWTNFFIEQRLEAQLKIAITENRIDKKIADQFESLYKKLPDIFPDESSSLLHGDLWSGNLITNSEGNPCLIDPAVFYGHREAELALTKLFGGFSHTFYSSYEEAFPLSPGFEKRVDLYNLYPLMVHVNLFGGGYVSQVVSILRTFV